CTCPLTRAGLTTLPQSSTLTYLTRVTLPVSMSTSTTATCVPKGKVKLGGSKTRVNCRPGSIPSGSFTPLYASRATAANVTDLPGAPLTATVPSTSSTSSNDASSSAAPIFNVFSRTSSIASFNALPPSASERLPPVPLLE